MSDFLSVLVIDEKPEILVFLARLLDSNGMRALLARNAEEAIGIARRSYVPIDVVLADVGLRPVSFEPGLSSASDLVGYLRRLRPFAGALYMSARIDAEVIRIELLDRADGQTPKGANPAALIESIRSAAPGTKVFASAMNGAAPSNRIS